MSGRDLPPQFEAHPRLPEHIKKLNDLLERYVDLELIPLNENRRTRIEEKLLSPLTALAAINDNAVPAAPQPVSIEQRIRTKLEKEVGEDLLQDGIQALETLSRNSHTGLCKRYLDRLLSSGAQQREIIGTMMELRAILYVAQDPALEILDANATIIKKGSMNRIEFFDLVGRDRQTGRLVLFEIKCDNSYGFTDFMFQFLGLGSEQKGKTYKPVSQKDVLLDPESFTLPSSYEADVKAGNYELRVLTHTRLYDFDSIYGLPMSIGRILTHLLQPSTPISRSKKVERELERKVLDPQLRSLQHRMADLADIPVRFELIGWYRGQRGN